MVNYNSELFVKLGNNLVWCVEGDEISITNGLDDKIIPILSVVNYMENRLGYTNITLQELIECCGMKVRKGAGNTTEQFKNILSDMIDLGYLINIDEIEIMNLKSTDRLNLKYNYNVDGQFFMLNANDFIEIMKLDKVDNVLLLKVYCYILARLYRREGDVRSGGKAEVTYFTVEQAIKDLDISETSYNKYINKLAEIGVLFFDNIGLVKREGKTITANNVYAISSADLKEGLKCSRLYYQEQGYKIVGKKTSKESKKIQGLQGKIKQESNRGIEREDLKQVQTELEDHKTKTQNKEQVTLKGKIKIEELKNEIRALAIDINTSAKHIKTWNTKYNTTVVECEEYDKLKELYINLESINDTYNIFA